MQPVGLQNFPLRGLCEEPAVQWKRQDLYTHQQTKKKKNIKILGKCHRLCPAQMTVISKTYT